jgi:glycosyltransferase involved in cell wall biosynthesis
MSNFKSKGLNDLVVHAGSLDDLGLNQLYNNASALVFPSLIEGFGLPLLEAMACGCPIAASEIPSTTEVAGDCPVYFDPHDPLSLTNALNRVVSEGRDSFRVGAGLQRSGMYSWDRTARAYLDVYEGLARG